MTNQLLELSIINREKRESSRLTKQIVWGVLIALTSVILYVPIEIEVKGILILTAGILAPLCISYVFKTPSKGTISLENESISLVIGKNKTIISLLPNTNIFFYRFPSIDGGISCFIEFYENNKKFLYELDLVFSSEKKSLESLKNVWKNKGINIITRETPPNKTNPCTSP